MEVEYIAAAGALVEVIDILGDDIYVIPFFELYECFMGCVGHAVEEAFAPLAVKAVDQRGVARESVGTAYIHYGIVFPQATCVAKGRDAAFRTDACAG